MHQVSSRTATEPFLPGLFAYCPTMDLVATVTRKDAVDVWRLNGQRVFGGGFEKDANGEAEGGEGKETNVKAVGWRRDGQILAVACSDGSLSLINAFTGKTAHRMSAITRLSPSSAPSSQQPQAQTRRRSSKISSQPSRPPTVSSLAWTTHFAYPSPSTVRSHLSSPTSTNKVTLDQLLSLRADVDKLLQLRADLPHELSNLDVEASLPKLATLPPTGVGVDDDVFSSRASVDVIFHDGGSKNASGGAGGVDVLLVGLSGLNGQCEVHLKIFDSFEVGTVEVGGVLPARKAGDAVSVFKMAGHPFLSTVFLIVEQARSEKEETGSSLHLLSLDLNFIPQTGRNLPLVARKATQLGNLLRYISQVQTQLVAEVKAAFDLPGRFLRNINEALAESDDSADFVFAAHHLAVTGECDPKVKEWLVDEVGDRGLKRWEKAVGDCLEVVRRMTSECLLPALERCLVVLSRLDGLAGFEGSGTGSRLGLDGASVGRVRETVDVMGILAEDLLSDVGTEMREFSCFMRWMKWEGEVEALEEGSERAEELRESWTGEAELKTVLEYVGGAMQESRLMKYLVRDGRVQTGGVTASFDEDPEVGFYAEYTKRRIGGSKDKNMPTLGDLVQRTQKQAETMFSQIAETFRKSIMANYLVELPKQCDAGTLDFRIVPEDDDEGLYRLVTISGDSKGKHHLQLFTVTLRQGSSKSVKHTTSTLSLSVPNATNVLDAKFVDDKTFLVLCETASDVRIYAHGVVLDEHEGDHAFELRHIFEAGHMTSGLRPAKLDVNGREGRRAVAVLDRDGLGYVVLDVDADDEVEGVVEEQTGDSTMSG